MVTVLISAIIVLCILGLAYWAAHRIAKGFGIPDPGPIMTVIDVALVVIAVLYLLSLLAGYPVPRLR